MTADRPPAVEARHLAKAYRAGTERVWAVRDVSLVVPAGAFAVLAGPSGSGKTTLLGLLGGLERPTEGRVLFAGRDLSDCSAAALARVRRRVGFVFQDFALIPDLPVWENVTYPLIPRGVGRRERVRVADEWLARVGLAAKAGAKPRVLSGGEKQRVALARALAGRPELILADEPTSNLDAETARAVLDALRDANAAGATVVASSHDPALAGTATLTVRLEAGRARVE